MTMATQEGAGRAGICWAASKTLQLREAQATRSGGVPWGTLECHGAQATTQMDF